MHRQCPAIDNKHGTFICQSNHARCRNALHAQHYVGRFFGLRRCGGGDLPSQQRRTGGEYYLANAGTKRSGATNQR